MIEVVCTVCRCFFYVLIEEHRQSDLRPYVCRDCQSRPQTRKDQKNVTVR